MVLALVPIGHAKHSGWFGRSVAVPYTRTQANNDQHLLLEEAHCAKRRGTAGHVAQAVAPVDGDCEPMLHGAHTVTPVWLLKAPV